MLPVADIQQLLVFFLNCFTCHIPKAVFFFLFFFSMQIKIAKNKIKFCISQVIMEPLFVSYFDQLIKARFIKTIKLWNYELNVFTIVIYLFKIFV